MGVTQITADNFETEVLKSTLPVLVDFWAAWCGPCRMLSPIIDELSEEVENVKFCKLNVDEVEAIAAKYHVASIPTLIVFKDGKVANTSVGVKSKSAILAMVQG